MKQYVYKSAVELAKLIREGKASSVDIVKEHLSHIKQHNGKLNAIVMLFEDDALKIAQKCDQEVEQGNIRGSLHGVPVTVKEQFWSKGHKSTINAKMHKDFTAPEDAVVVSRIKKSGAIILGKTNVPQFLLDYQVHGDIYPEGKNPYNTDYTPGGSTGGGAAALAAGFTPLELGADFGGSVRVPSLFCGLYGLKPTEKTVPLHGSYPLPKKEKTFISHMATAGPMARNIDDLEVLWKVIVGAHKSDRNIPRIAWEPPTKTKLSDYNIAWVDQWPSFPVSSEVSSTIKDLVQKISQKGTNIQNQSPKGNLHDQSLRLYIGTFPYIVAQEAPWFIRALMKMQMKSTIFKGWNKHIDELNKAFKMQASHYGEMMLLKSKVTSAWESFFEQYDFLICPMGFGSAYKRTKIGSRIHCDGKDMPYISYIWPYVACFNASGHPAISIPLGIGKEGLPLGVQIVGPYWSEPALLHFAKQVASLTDGFVKPNGF